MDKSASALQTGPSQAEPVVSALRASVPSAAGLQALRQPFPEHQISKLPKETKAQIDARKADRNVMVFNCKVCGGHHHKDAVHLDYVGHAALTDRLLDSDIEWTWEPLAFDANGLPALDANRGLWIKLTVCGVTRLGYGSADGKIGGDAIKEIIGDALRNAAMRFGAALDLWHKGDLHLDDEPDASRRDGQSDSTVSRPANDISAPIDQTQFGVLQALIETSGADIAGICKAYKVASLNLLPASNFDRLKAQLEKKLEAKNGTTN